MSSFKPLGNNVLVRIIEQDKPETALYIPDDRRKPRRALVVEVSDGVVKSFENNSYYESLPVDIGDEVLIGAGVGTYIEVDGEDLVLISVPQILGIFGGSSVTLTEVV
jgi:co-chaperonin GroES (HSP10)